MKYDISNAPNATNFPLLKYKYVMNEPFVQGSSAENQWSHDQLDFKRARDMAPGYKLNQHPEPIERTEEIVKKEREDLWS